MWQAILDFVKSFKLWTIIYPNEGGVRTRCGRYHSTLDAGFYWQWPIIDEIVTLDVMPQIVDLRSQNVTSSDGKPIMISGAIRYSISNVNKAYYHVQDIDVTLCNLVLTEIAKYASSKLMKDIDIISLGRDIGDTISDEVESKWGITLTDVTMTDISPCRVISLTDRKD